MKKKNWSDHYDRPDLVNAAWFLNHGYKMIFTFSDKRHERTTPDKAPVGLVSYSSGNLLVSIITRKESMYQATESDGRIVSEIVWSSLCVPNWISDMCRFHSRKRTIPFNFIYQDLQQKRSWDFSENQHYNGACESLKILEDIVKELQNRFTDPDEFMIELDKRCSNQQYFNETGEWQEGYNAGLEVGFRSIAFIIRSNQ